MKVVVGPLQKCELSGFFTRNMVLAEWKCVPVLVLYFCNNPESNEMLSVRLFVAAKRSCIRYMTTEVEKISNELAVKSFVRKSKMIRSRFLQIPKSDKGTVDT